MLRRIFGSERDGVTVVGGGENYTMRSLMQVHLVQELIQWKDQDSPPYE